MAREKCGLLAGPRTVPLSWVSYQRPSYECGVICRHARPKLHMYFVIPECAVSHVTSALDIPAQCIVLGTLRATMT